MSPTQDQTSIGSIQRWEAASARLMDSMVAYADSCIGIVSSPNEYVLDSRDLVFRIDTNINSFHTEIKNRLIRSRRALAHTRNKLAATFYTVPQEVLNNIFAFAMLDNDGSKLPDLERGIRTYYRQLYSLLGVCSVWNKAGRSQNELWTPIPMLSNGSKWITQDAAERSLGKVGDRPLQLVARVTRGASPAFMSLLNNPRRVFSAINLTTDSPTFLHETLGHLLPTEDPCPLRELSICHLLDPASTHRHPIPDAFITGANAAFSPRPYNMHQHLRPLRILRLRGIYLHWQYVTPSRLVELRLQSVTLGPQPSIDHLVTGLARASELRKIELISISLSPRGTVPEQVGAILPNLQTFHVEDIYSDAILPMFLVVAPGSHHTTFHITQKCFQVVNEFMENVAIPDMDLMLFPIQNIPVLVHTLILSGSLHNGASSGNWLSHQYLGRLLEAVPSITTLKIHNWNFLQEWNGLIHPPSNASFPKLQSFYTSKANILEIEGLKAFVSSHSLEKLVIGATVLPLDEESPRPLSQCEDLMKWLRSEVSNFSVIDHTYEPPEFKSDEWQRW